MGGVAAALETEEVPAARAVIAVAALLVARAAAAPHSVQGSDTAVEAEASEPSAQDRVIMAAEVAARQADTAEQAKAPAQSVVGTAARNRAAPAVEFAARLAVWFVARQADTAVQAVVFETAALSPRRSFGKTSCHPRPALRSYYKT